MGSFFLIKVKALCDHFHPTVRRYANDIMNNPQDAIKYPGNPLLDFSIANFLDRFSFKKAKK